MRPNRSLSRLSALGLAAAIALSACGDADDTAAPSGDPGTTAPPALTGDPILIGFANTEEGPVALPEVTIAAKAAVAHVNANGGVGGRPLELVACKTNGSPESSIACANEFVSKEVVVQLEGMDLGADAKLQPLAEAGIPIFGITSPANAIGEDPEATLLAAPEAAALQGAVKLLVQTGATKAVMITADVGPQVKAGYEKQLVPAAKAAGLDMSLAFYNPAAPDFTSAVTAAQAKKADALWIGGSEADCMNGVKTTSTLGFKGVVFTSACTEFVKALGAQAKGVYSMSYLIPPSAKASATADKQAQIQVYETAMATAGASDKVDSFAVYGFSGVMTLTEALRQVTGPITVSSAKTAIKAYRGDVFLGQPDVDCTKRPAGGANCGDTLIALQARGDGTQDLAEGGLIKLG